MALDFEKYKKEQFCLNKEWQITAKKMQEYKDKGRKNKQVYCKGFKSSW